MFQTEFGTFDGTSWERLCQAAFKIKFGSQYQQMYAYPGDYGLEGWTLEGHGFQCYCPEKHYTQAELYVNIRKKITDDVGKLKRNCEEIADRIGQTKIREWLLVTPVIHDNKLHKHARAKEREARSWNLSILTADFSIRLQDAACYIREFEEHRRNVGTQVPLGPPVERADVFPAVPEEFDKLIERKNRIRLAPKASNPGFLAELKKINDITAKKFVACDAKLATIERTSPQVFERISRVIGLFAEEMAERQITWSADAEGLIVSVREELAVRLERDLENTISYSDTRHIADLMVSRWLAVCQLDFLE